MVYHKCWEIATGARSALQRNNQFYELNRSGRSNNGHATILYKTGAFSANSLFKSYYIKLFFYFFLVIFLKGGISRTIFSFQYFPCRNSQRLSLSVDTALVEWPIKEVELSIPARVSTWTNHLDTFWVVRAGADSGLISGCCKILQRKSITVRCVKSKGFCCKLSWPKLHRNGDIMALAWVANLSEQKDFFKNYYHFSSIPWYMALLKR